MLNIEMMFLFFLQFDLVCGNANSLRVAQTILMAGILVGGLLFGPLSES